MVRMTDTTNRQPAETAHATASPSGHYTSPVPSMQK